MEHITQYLNIREERSLGHNERAPTSNLPLHVEKFNDILTIRCKQSPKDVSPMELTFATGFIAAFLFLRVKGTRPMSYEFFYTGDD